jgi:hypothetical protein
MRKDDPVTTKIAFKRPPPVSVDAGSAFACSVVAAWPPATASERTTYGVREGERTLQTGPLPQPASEDGSIALTLRAPDETGEHRLTLVLTSVTREGRDPAESTLSFTLTTVPHETSLAVWDIPSPVVRGERFEIKAGARCSSACRLARKIIEIRDETGTLTGSAPLGDTILPGTTALVFTAISLEAPRTIALHNWTASFAPSELKLAHGSATSRFSFATVAEPEHSVSVKVVRKDTKAPIAGAQVRLGLYGAETDDTGTAIMRVPKGAFPLVVARTGYKMPERTIKVAKDVRVRIAAETLPEPDPFALWSG